MELPALFYLPPNLAQYLSLAVWKFAKQSNIIVIPIPKSVWATLTSVHLGLFRKLHDRFKNIAYQKYAQIHVQFLMLTKMLF